MKTPSLAYWTLGAIITVEALSFFSFLDPQQTGVAAFAVASIAAIALTIRKLEYGVMLVFGELVIGSFGRILELSINGFDVSIRMALWLIVIMAWLGRAIKKRRIEFYHSPLFKPYLALAAVLGWGIAWGFIRGNPLGLVFSDVNNYLYFVLIFPVYDVFVLGRDAMYRVFTVLMAAFGWLSIKTIVLFYIFSHELFGLQDVLYAWSRRMQLAEITNISPLYITSRIFMQSQVWILFSLFIGLGYVLSLRAPRVLGINSASNPDGNSRDRHGRSLGATSLAMTVIMSSALIMSFSRSFWLAGLVSLIIFCGALLFILREKFKTVFIFGSASAGIIAVSVLFTLGVAAFPIPRGSSSMDLIKERAAQFTGESAVSSRYAQIRPLLTAIAKHPALGSGFGTAVTYESQDPRVLANHPDGRYTTTAFELGWLEMWLKIGLLGVGAYLYLLWQIFKQATRIIRIHPNDPNKNSDRYLILGGLVGLVAVVTTHGVSPYLNHPLGIGVVILLTSVVDKRYEIH